MIIMMNGNNGLWLLKYRPKKINNNYNYLYLLIFIPSHYYIELRVYEIKRHVAYLFEDLE